jgi:hypothetical protein
MRGEGDSAAEAEDLAEAEAGKAASTRRAVW